MRNKSRNLTLILAFTVLTLFPVAYAQPWGDHPFPPRFNPDDIPDFAGKLHQFFIGRTIAAIINTVLLGYLLYTYYSLYRKTKSPFTLGLVIMTIALLLFTLSSNPILYWILGDRALLGAFSILPDIFTTIATITLIYLSRQ